jgi:hypothetical protein
MEDVIKEIKGSGLEDETNEVVAKVGGGPDSIDIVLDGVPFYIMNKKIGLAELALSNPTPRKCADCYDKSFRAPDILACYRRIIREGLNPCLYKNMTTTIEKILLLEKKILEKFILLGKKNLQTNASLPGLYLAPEQSAMYDPSALKDYMDELVKYVRNLNVNSILTAPVSCNIHCAAPFEATADKPDQQAWELILQSLAPGKPPRLPTPSGDNAQEYISAMKKIMEIETAISKYAIAVEKYHVLVMAKLNEIQEFCDKVKGNIIPS